MKLNTHTATYLDAPFHFFPDKETIDQIPIEKYIGRAVIVKLTGANAVGILFKLKQQDG